MVGLTDSIKLITLYYCFNTIPYYRPDTPSNVDSEIFKPNHENIWKGMDFATAHMGDFTQPQQKYAGTGENCKNQVIYKISG